MTKTLLRLSDRTPICIDAPELRKGVTAWGVFDKGDIVLKAGPYVLDDQTFFEVGEYGKVVLVKTISEMLDDLINRPEPMWHVGVPAYIEETDSENFYPALVLPSAVEAITALAAYVYFSDDWEASDWKEAYREAIEMYGDAKTNRPDLEAILKLN